MKSPQSLGTAPEVLHELVHGREYTDGLLAGCVLADRRVEPPIELTDDADNSTARGPQASPLMPTLLV